MRGFRVNDGQTDRQTDMTFASTDLISYIFQHANTRVTQFMDQPMSSVVLSPVQSVTVEYMRDSATPRILSFLNPFYN